MWFGQQDLLGIGQYIVFPTPAADGEEVLDGAPISPDSSALPDPVPDPVGVVDKNDDEDDGSGGAAMNISDCAPSWNPYRALYVGGSTVQGMLLPLPQSAVSTSVVIS
jgi:hypothetical protein